MAAQDWQKIVADIIQASETLGEGRIIVEITDLPHAIWQRSPGAEHEFPDQRDKYLKESHPILNLTVKLWCRCQQHIAPQPDARPIEEVSSHEYTDEEKKALRQFFDSFEYP